jgi:hypothetical protein
LPSIEALQIHISNANISFVGMFFQWILCGATLLVGIIVQVIRGTHNFYPLVMIGGLVWETGIWQTLSIILVYINVTCSTVMLANCVTQVICVLGLQKGMNYMYL